MRILINLVADHIMNCDLCATDTFIIDLNNNVEEICSLTDVPGMAVYYSRNAEIAIHHKVNVNHNSW